MKKIFPDVIEFVFHVQFVWNKSKCYKCKNCAERDRVTRRNHFFSVQTPIKDHLNSTKISIINNAIERRGRKVQRAGGFCFIFQR